MEQIEVLEKLGSAFELLGVLIMVLGVFYTVVSAMIDVSQGKPTYRATRRRVGRSLLLGLEVLVAADIIETIAVENTIENALILGILVLVRTVLSISLDMEIDGVSPWRKAEFEASQGSRLA